MHVHIFIHVQTFISFPHTIAVEVVGPGTPPDGHVSGAWLYSAGCPAANEEEPGKKT